VHGWPINYTKHDGQHKNSFKNFFFLSVPVGIHFKSFETINIVQFDRHNPWCHNHIILMAFVVFVFKVCLFVFFVFFGLFGDNKRTLSLVYVCICVCIGVSAKCNYHDTINQFDTFGSESGQQRPQ
jgi:hypothetical protein